VEEDLEEEFIQKVLSPVFGSGFLKGFWQYVYLNMYMCFVVDIFALFCFILIIILFSLRDAKIEVYGDEFGEIN
jgi:hypothetical protein